MTSTLPANVAAILVDPLRAFCEGGGLPVEGGNAIMPAVNALRAKTEKGYWIQDWHPPGHASFASTHSREPFTRVWLKDGEIVGEYQEGQTPSDSPAQGALIQMLWPDHAIQETPDAEFHPDLDIPTRDRVLRKGSNPKIDSYSCVVENDGLTRPRFADGNTLPDRLRLDEVNTVVLGGLALDVCVGDSALDLKNEGFRVIVVLDATAAITPEGRTAMLKKFASLGVETVNSVDGLDSLLANVSRPQTNPSPAADPM